ncbi:MAG: hypothetical protein NC489_47220 [Ruminococcus flavefaciens]|nr:hypothetical protein [Ruminococcus flavefaciens]
MIDLKNASSQEIASYFSHEVNNIFFKPDKIAEEQKNSKQMKELDLCWIKILSSGTYRSDLRNEKSAIKGRQLADIPFVKRKIEFVDNPKMEDVAKRMEMDHRTLQQTFSGLVFYHFLQSCNQKEAQMLIKVMGDFFYRLPMI